MSGFKAETAVEKLEWDFRPYIEARGVSPEASGTKIWTFQQNWSNVTSAARRTAISRAALRDKEDRERSAEAIESEFSKWAGLTWDEAVDETSNLMAGMYGEVNQEELHERLAKLVDEVTDGCPNTEQIMALPGRVRASYLGWFVGQVASPEA